MKTPYYVRIAIKTESFEKESHILVEAESRKEAGELAIEAEGHDLDETPECTNEGLVEDVSDACGDFFYSIEKEEHIRQLTEEEYKTLSEFLK